MLKEQFAGMQNLLKIQLSRRQKNLAGFLACAGMMSYALYAEHFLMLMPCPLCIFQRIAVITLAIVFLVAAIHNPVGYGRSTYTVLILLATTAGAGVSGRHVWLQNIVRTRFRLHYR